MSEVTRLALRLVRRGALAVAAIVAGFSALVVVQYRQTFAGALDSAALQALAASPAIRTMFGRPLALDDPGGFTVWRTGAFMTILTALWAALAAARITRGEEEAGRWEVLLSGRLRLSGLVARHLAVVGAAALASGLVLAAAMVAAGTSASGALIYGAVIGLIGVAGAAAGTLTGQLAADRRTAAGLAIAVVGAWQLLRMGGDGGAGWLSWLSPFGLLALARPYAGDRMAPLLVLAAEAALLVVAAVAAARGRDLGAGRLGPGRARSRPALVRSLPRFALRRALRPLAGWSAGLGAWLLLVGALSGSLTRFLADNPVFATAAGRAGFPDLDTPEGFAGAILGLVGVPIGVFAATRVAADAADEAARRFALVFAAPVARARWAAVEAGLLGLGCVAIALACGLATWAGAALAGAGLGLWPALAGALNLVPVALLGLGAALWALGWAPGAVVWLGTLPGAGGFLLAVFARAFAWPAWLAWPSPYRHLARVPAQPVDWPGLAALVAVAAALAIAGAAGYRRRDLLG